VQETGNGKYSSYLMINLHLKHAVTATALARKQH